jgi:hypothetical protein
MALSKSAKAEQIVAAGTPCQGVPRVETEVVGGAAELNRLDRPKPEPPAHP